LRREIGVIAHYGRGVAFFRNKIVSGDSSNCKEKGTVVVCSLVIWETPEPVNLERIAYGALSSDGNGEGFWQLVNYRDTGFGRYSPSRVGVVKEGSEEFKLKGGEDPTTPVDALFCTGFWFGYPVWYKEGTTDYSLKFLQEYSRDKCEYIAVWYRFWGAETGRLLGEIRVDLPLEHEWPHDVTWTHVQNGGKNEIHVEMESWGGNEVAIVDYTDSAVEAQWAPYFAYPVSFNRQYVLPVEKREMRFFRVR